MFYRIRCVSCIVHKLYHFLARATPNPIRLPKAKAAPPIIAMPFNPSRKRQNLKQQFRIGFSKRKVSIPLSMRFSIVCFRVWTCRLPGSTCSKTFVYPKALLYSYSQKNNYYIRLWLIQQLPKIITLILALPIAR